MATTCNRSRPPSATASRARVLLDRYPNLSEQELAELINLLPRLSLLEQGLMTVDDRLSPRLADFHRDHGRKLWYSMGALSARLAIPAMLAIATLWWIFG